MLKKLLIMLCLGAFVVAIGCGEKEEPEPEKNGEKPPVGDQDPE